MAILNFNSQGISPQIAFDPVPAGWYTAHITGSELKPTKSGEGGYLELKMVVCEGDFANRVIYDRLNLYNTNETAREIAQRTLSAICHATGVFVIEDSQQLHGIPLQVKVSVRPAQGENTATNEVKGYRYANGASIGAPGGASAPAAMPSQPMPSAPAAPLAPPSLPAPTQAPAAPVVPTAPVPAAPAAYAPASAPAQAAPAAPAAVPVPPWAQPAPNMPQVPHAVGAAAPAHVPTAPAAPAAPAAPEPAYPATPAAAPVPPWAQGYTSAPF